MAVFQPTGAGYDVNATRKDLPHHHNGRLYLGNFDSGDGVNLYVHEVQTGFALGGSTAQSASTRSFFARNFIQPEFNVLCQSPNQSHYGQVVEFIRASQKLAIAGTEANLEIYTANRLGVNAGSDTYKRVKGDHQPIKATGYVKQVPRQHEHFVYAPEYTFSFVVAKMISPSGWADQLLPPRMMMTWHEIITTIMKGEYIGDPDVTKKDKKPPNIARPLNRPPVARGPAGTIGNRPT